MEKNKEPIQQLTEIRNMMERSSRFMSLSGLSGVSAGITALIGSVIAMYRLNPDQKINFSQYGNEHAFAMFSDSWLFLVTDALIVLAVALFAGIYFTTRKARQKSFNVWDSAAQRMVINLFIPLVTGGFFCLILIYHHLAYLLAPSTLLFYGLALINASKYTYHEIRVLGISEIILGLLAAFFAGYGLLFWAFGFGVLHIFYGLMVYFRYERKPAVPEDLK
jgi:hypothetical protein